MHKFNLAIWLSELFNDLSYAIFGAIAGAVGYLIGINDVVKFSWYKFTVGMLGSGFASVLVAKICDAMDYSEEWKIVAVGFAGALGYNFTIKSAKDYLFNKFGIERRIKGARSKED